jgi:hypothetical protein
MPFLFVPTANHSQHWTLNGPSIPSFLKIGVLTQPRSRSDPLPVRPNWAVTVARFQEPRRARRLSMIQMYIRPSKTNRERFLDLGVGQEWPTARKQCADLESDSLARRATLKLRVAR